MAPIVIARIPAALDPSTIPITPPIIESPAVQFRTPNALDGEPLVGIVGGVHDPVPKGSVVCPHEHPASHRRQKLRETSIDMIVAGLPTI